jgi:valyl-tRNA synthetase
MIESLATCTLKEIRPDLTPASNAVRAAAAGVDIFVEGLVDEAAEKQRVAKACDDLARTIKTLRGRLSNESYISKAPPALVQQTKDQLAAAEAERAKLGCPEV